MARVIEKLAWKIAPHDLGLQAPAGHKLEAMSEYRLRAAHYIEMVSLTIAKVRSGSKATF
jgi:hypothetical protein